MFKTGAPHALTHKRFSTAVLCVVQDAVQEAVLRLTQLDGAATAAIVLRFMPEAHTAVIHSLAATPDLQFRCALTLSLFTSRSTAYCTDYWQCMTGLEVRL